MTLGFHCSINWIDTILQIYSIFPIKSICLLFSSSLALGCLQTLLSAHKHTHTHIKKGMNHQHMFAFTNINHWRNLHVLSQRIDFGLLIIYLFLDFNLGIWCWWFMRRGWKFCEMKLNAEALGKKEITIQWSVYTFANARDNA